METLANKRQLELAPLSSANLGSSDSTKGVSLGRRISRALQSPFSASQSTTKRTITDQHNNCAPTRSWARMDDDSDPTRPTLEALCAAGTTFSLPWTRERKALFAGFDSQKVLHADGPWRSISPFAPEQARMRSVLPDGIAGRCSFRDHMSTSSMQSMDHLSLNVGLTVGYPFLNAGVEVDYDRTVMQNENVSPATNEIDSAGFGIGENSWLMTHHSGHTFVTKQLGGHWPHRP